jgi:cytochrome d ubiquinol oxidase subunit II
MSDFLRSIGLPEIIAGLMVLALNAYVLMGGADFGGGVWDLLARGEHRQAQRDLIAEAIAPIWEANHVWLIVVVVVLFTAFPTVYATLATVLHIPLSIFLVGIVLRGSAFVFRSYGSRDDSNRRRWGLTFAVASVFAPIMLGVVIGTLSSGAVSAADARIGRASFADVFVAPWFAPFPIVVGCLALALFAYLAAVYLAIAAEDAALRDDFRARALASAIAVCMFAGLALIIARREAPHVVAGVLGKPWSVPLQLGTALCAIVALGALVRRHYRVARIAAAAQVSFILWGWVLAQYPFIVPPALTVSHAAAPAITLRLLLIGLTVGALVLIPSLRYLFRTFAGRH